MRFQSEEEVLESIHSALHKKFWPEHLTVGGIYQLQADDQDGDTETGWYTITIVDKDTIKIETSGSCYNLESEQVEDVTFQAKVCRERNPLTFRAMLYVALAFRLDNPELGLERHKAELKRTAQEGLTFVYDLLDVLPWPSTLEVDQPYTLTDQEGMIVGSYHTLMNDSYLVVGKDVFQNTTGRIRDYFGGGHKLNTYYALRILSEAIRLENEGGTNGCHKK